MLALKRLPEKHTLIKLAAQTNFVVVLGSTICTIVWSVLTEEMDSAYLRDLVWFVYFSALLLGPFYGAIAVPSVTRCRCRRRCCCGHRCAGGDTWWMAMRRAAARSGEWAQHFFQMLLVLELLCEFSYQWQCSWSDGKTSANCNLVNVSSTARFRLVGFGSYIAGNLRTCKYWQVVNYVSLRKRLRYNCLCMHWCGFVGKLCEYMLATIAKI